MTKIKICGITRIEDALEACRAGADALGFNFSRKSPRVVTPDLARSIIKKLPPFIATAGIFVEQTPEEINDVCRFCGLNIAQLHSDHYSTEGATAITEATVIKVYRPEDDFAVAKVREYAEKSGVNAFLFDAYRPGMDGGTGERIDASLAERIFHELKTSSYYTILAGGLNAANVSEAIRSIRPYAVDTASGVESEPGIKDSSKMKAFVRAVREALPYVPL